MNKHQKFIYKGVPKTEVDSMLKVIKREGKIKIKGVGTFTVRTRKKSKMFDNINKKSITVAAKKKILFKPTCAINRYLNGK